MNDNLKKVAIFAFSDDKEIFSHALLNALDMSINGYDVRLIIDGRATSLIGKFNNPGEPYYKLYNEVKSYGLIDCICDSCAEKYGTKSDVEKQHLPLCNNLSGHTSMVSFIKRGYQIVVI